MLIDAAPTSTETGKTRAAVKPEFESRVLKTARNEASTANQVQPIDKYTFI
jgi:hypothetical protein